MNHPIASGVLVMYHTRHAWLWIFSISVMCLDSGNYGYGTRPHYLPAGPDPRRHQKGSEGLFVSFD